MRYRFVVLLGLCAASWPCSLVLAQSTDSRAFVATIAPSFYRLPVLGRGTALAMLGGFEWDLKGPLTIQAVGTFWQDLSKYEFGSGTITESHVQFIPEVGLQLRPRTSGLQPFLGTGLGLALGSGQLRTGLTLYGAGGVQWRLAETWWFRTELRIRTIRPFEGRTLEVGLGIVRHR